LFEIFFSNLKCRECIEQAILVRQFFYHMVFSVFQRSEMDVQSALENDLLTFDEDLRQLIDIYLSFITDWVHSLVSGSNTSSALIVLKDEWNFCKNNLYFVTSSEDMYAKRFCALCSLVNGSLVHSLSGLDSKYKDPLMEFLANMESGLTMGGNGGGGSGGEEQIRLNEDDNNSDNISNIDKQLEDVALYSQEDSQSKNNSNSVQDNNDNSTDAYEAEIPFDVNIKCNQFKEELNKLRKRCMGALEFCSSLIGDLELAAKYSVQGRISKILKQLKDTNHVLIMFTNPELHTSYNNTPNSSKTSFDSFTSQSQSQSPTEPKDIKGNSFIHSTSTSSTKEKESSPLTFMIFVPQEFSRDKAQIVRLLFITSAKDDYTRNKQRNDKKSSKKSSKKTCFSNHQKQQQKDEETDEQNEIEINKQKNDSNSTKNQKVPPRRLSSSNNFLDLNGGLLKLSQMAKQCSPTSMKESENPNSLMLSSNVNSDGYLIYLQLPKEKDSEDVWKWDGQIVWLHASMPVRRSLYQHKNNSDPSIPTNLILIVPTPSILKQKRIELKSLLKDSIQIIRDKTSFHPNIEYAIDELKESILYLRSEADDFIKGIEKDLKTNSEYDNAYTSGKCLASIIDQKYLSEIWRVSYNFGIDLQNECIKFITEDSVVQFISGLAKFCIMWCEYIVDKTERGKGTTGIYNLFFL
jgi:hypothetical protein